MALIARETKLKYKPLEVKIEESLHARLTAYAEYLESSPAHVVSEALRYVIEKDREFAAKEGKSAPNPELAKVARKSA